MAKFARAGMYLTNGPPNPCPDEITFIASRDPNRTIKTHVYYPSSNTPQPPSPVLINFHGSGFVVPRHGEDDEYCRNISTATKYIVLDCPYRLAPQHPHPAALEDVEDIINYVLSRPDLYDASRLSISGFSAGGNLALIAAGVLFPPSTFQSLIAFYPPTNVAIPSSEKRHGPDKSMRPALPPFAIDFLLECYLQSDTPLSHPTVSPFFADMERFPRRMLFITAAGDNLCQEAEAMAEKLALDEKRLVVLRRMDRCNHAFDKNAKWRSVEERAKDEAFGLVIDMLVDVRGRGYSLF